MYFPWRLTRYFIRLFLVWFTMVTLATLIIIFLFEFSELLRRASSRPFIGYEVLIKMTFLKLPIIAEKLLPFISLFASIITLWRLNRSREIDVVRAAGISVWQLLSSMALVCLIIGALNLIVFNPITTKMKNCFDFFDNKHFGKKNTSGVISESGMWVRDMNNDHLFVFHIGRIGKNPSTMYDLTIFKFQGETSFIQRIDATKGVIQDNHDLDLQNVWISNIEEIPQYRSSVSFPTTLSLDKLHAALADPESLSFWSLISFIKLLEKSGISSLEHRLHWHSLIAQSFWIAAMTLLAAACTLRPAREGYTLPFIIAGVLLGFALYVLRDIIYAVGLSSAIPVILAAWSPVIISFCLGITLLLHIEGG